MTRSRSDGPPPGTSRRNLLAGAAMMPALLAWLPAACSAMPEQGRLPPPGVPLRLSLRLEDGRDVAFEEASAADAGAYREPSGAFVQGHRIARSDALPTVTVHFCRDEGAQERPEVWVYNGTMFSEPAVDLPAYAATIAAGSEVLLDEPVPYHSHASWWRWQPAGPRPAIQTVEALIARHLIPPFDRSLPVAHSLAPDAHFPAPMGDGGLLRSMPNAGERNDIGLFTGEQARYIFVGDNWDRVLANAEGHAAIPIHWIDEETGRPFFIYDRPNVTAHENEHHDPDYSFGGSWAHWQVDNAHLPNALTLPVLMTGDPFYVLLAQTQPAFWWTRWQRWPIPGDLSVGPNYEDEVRGQAWRARDLLIAWLATPETVPGWLQTRAQLAQIMEGYAAALRHRWLVAPDPAQAIFHLTNLPGTMGPWQENLFASVLGWWVLADAPGDVLDLFTWKVDCILAMASGRDGYPRQICTPYAFEGHVFQASNWGEAFELTGWPPPSGSSLQKENVGGDPEWGYASYALGALEFATIHGIQAAVGPRDWMRSQVHPTGQLYAKHAWSREAAL